MDAWHQFLCEVEKELGRETVQRWLKPLKVVDFDAGNLYLEAQDSFQLSWFKTHIAPRIKNSLLSATGRQIKVHISLQNSPPARPKKMEKGAAKENRYLPALNLVQDSLDPEAALENFYLSESNDLLMKLIKEMLSAAGTMSNPLFIYGESGAGKSHLLMAIAHEFHRRNLKVFFIRAGTFMEHVVAAIRNGAMNEFRRTYRAIDVLIVDDVHLFARKGATQEEFFHTFNSLHGSGKQIILSASSSPQFLEAIEARLISRFEWGIVLRLEKMQEEETRRWLTQKANALSLPLAETALDFLMKTLRSNTKSLQRALQALTLRLHLKPSSSEKIDAEKVKILLGDLLAQEKQKELNPPKILRAVANYYGIKPEDLTGRAQTKEVAIPRQMAMHLCRQLLHLSYLEIGRIFSRDHSTAMSSVKLVEQKIKAEEKECSSAKLEITRQLHLGTAD